MTLDMLLERATPGPWLVGTGSGGGATTYVYEDDGTGQQCNAIAGCTLDYVRLSRWGIARVTTRSVFKQADVEGV